MLFPTSLWITHVSDTFRMILKRIQPIIFIVTFFLSYEWTCAWHVTMLNIILSQFLLLKKKYIIYTDFLSKTYKPIFRWICKTYLKKKDYHRSRTFKFYGVVHRNENFCGMHSKCKSFQYSLCFFLFLNDTKYSKMILYNDLFKNVFLWKPTIYMCI